MTYDHWKTTNPDDAWLGPDPDDELEPEQNDDDDADRRLEDYLQNKIDFPFQDDGE